MVELLGISVILQFLLGSNMQIKIKPKGVTKHLSIAVKKKNGKQKKIMYFYPCWWLWEPKKGNYGYIQFTKRGILENH